MLIAKYQTLDARLEEDVDLELNAMTVVRSERKHQLSAEAEGPKN
jgi:hypothetical protein